MGKHSNYAALNLTPEEAEELARWDAMCEAEDLTFAEYEQSDFIDEMNNPEKAAQKKRTHETYANFTAEQKAAHAKAVEKYYWSHVEQVKEYHSKWYQENKERIAAQQRDYRIRTGRQMTPEQKEEKKAATKAKYEAGKKPKKEKPVLTPKQLAQKAKRAAYQRAYYEAHKEQLTAYQKKWREEHKNRK